MKTSKIGGIDGRTDTSNIFSEQKATDTIKQTNKFQNDSNSYFYMGAITKTINKSFQGALVDEKNKELFQILDGGHTIVLDMNTLRKIREFDLPTSGGSGHFSSVEWLDKENKKFITTACKGKVDDAYKIYVYDISNESEITMTTVICHDMSSDNYSYMGCLAYDSKKKILYVGGYAPNDSTRNSLLVTKVDMSPYVDNSLTIVNAIGDKFTTEVYHLQDGCFYNNKIYYLVDSNTGRNHYNTFAVLEINPSSKSITNIYNIELPRYYEAENIAVVPENKPYLIMSYWDGFNTAHYYKKYLDY